MILLSLLNDLQAYFANYALIFIQGSLVIFGRHGSRIDFIESLAKCDQGIQVGGNITCLPVINFFFAVDPKSGQLWKDIDDFERLQIVDENIWKPQVVDQLEVNWNEKLYQIERNSFFGFIVKTYAYLI